MKESVEDGYRWELMVNTENKEVGYYRYALEAVKEIAHPNCAMATGPRHL